MVIVKIVLNVNNHLVRKSHLNDHLRGIPIVSNHFCGFVTGHFFDSSHYDESFWRWLIVSGRVFIVNGHFWGMLIVNGHFFKSSRCERSLWIDYLLWTIVWCGNPIANDHLRRITIAIDHFCGFFIVNGQFWEVSHYERNFWGLLILIGPFLKISYCDRSFFGMRCERSLN